MIWEALTEESLRVRNVPAVVARRVEQLAQQYEIAEWEYSETHAPYGQPVSFDSSREAVSLLPATSRQWLEVSRQGMIPLEEIRGVAPSADFWVIQRHGWSRLIVERLVFTGHEPFKLSAAIRLAASQRGRFYAGQSYSRYMERGLGVLKVNVVKAAFLAAGGQTGDDWDEVGNDDFVIQEMQAEGFDLARELDGPQPLGRALLLSVLLYLNDSLRWSFEQIADWLEPQGL